MKRKLLSVLLCLAVCLSLLPGMALAAEDFSVKSNGTEVAGIVNSENRTTDYTISTAGAEVTVSGSTTNGRIIVNSNATITLESVTMDLDKCIGSPIEIATGVTATLILKGENTIEAFAQAPGILVNQGATLTIRADSTGGSLRVAGAEASERGSASMGGERWR